MKKTILIIGALLWVFNSNAQSGKLKKAENYYEKVAYSEAAELYTELLGSEVDSPQLKAKLADCYYQMGETKQAEMYYAQVVSTSEVKQDDIYKYAQALKQNGKYSESDQWMTKFNQTNTEDSRGKQLIENKAYLTNIEKQRPFFQLNHLNINTSKAEFGGYPMGSTAYFVSNRKSRGAVKRTHTWNDRGFLDLFSADINDDGSLSNPDFQSKKINKKYHEGPLCFSSDGKTVYFTRNNMSSGPAKKDDQGIQNLKMFKATIQDGKWVDQEELSINSRMYSVGHPTLSADGKIIYFSSDMPGGFGGADIYQMSINEDGSFGEPKNLGESVNTEGQEMFPWMMNDGTLLFSSDGHLGLGGLDIFAIIPSQNGTFSKRVNVGKPINSPSDDFAMIIGNDGKSGYVSSNRDGGTGDDDIYSVQLIRKFKINLQVKGLITDQNSGEILPGASVTLLDPSGNTVATTTANQEAKYSFDIEPGTDYTIAVHKNDYFDNQREFSTKNLPDGTEEIKKDLSLEKDPGLALYTLITDSKTNQPIEGVSLKIIDNMTGEEFLSGQTPASGDFLKGIADKKIDERLSYNIQLEKEGYFPKTVTFNHRIDKPGVINVHEIMKGGISLDKEVKDLAEMIQINPINFDLGKWNIRPDAKVELDKIVEIMTKYPNMKVELGSHTDCRASKAFNMRLSDKRAKASAEYIKSKISTPDRIYGKGYGESKLLNGCECEGSVKSDCSEEEHEKNRRTEFRVISVGSGENVKVIESGSNSFDN